LFPLTIPDPPIRVSSEAMWGTEMNRTLVAVARGEPVRGAVDAATIQAAAEGGMVGLLARNAELPSRDLQIRASAVEARSLYLSGELSRLVDALRIAGVPQLSLKGAVASQQLYGHPGLRSFADLDIMVSESDAVRAEEVLFGLGYRDEEAMTRAQRLTKRRFHNATPFVNNERGTIVDLHWRFGHVQFPLVLTFDDAWKRRAVVELGGVPVPTLGWSDLVVFTCSHAAKHFWARFEMLAQIASLARSPMVEWREVDRIAISSRAARQVGLSFLIANHLTLSEVPPLPRCLDASRPVFPRMQRRLAIPHSRDSGGRDLFLILDRKRDVFAAVAAAIFVPTHSDWSAADIPAILHWLLRPIRLVGQRLRRSRPIAS
jgi:putative nucleotidyltransferase-like protein